MGEMMLRVVMGTLIGWKDPPQISDQEPEIIITLRGNLKCNFGQCQ